MRFDGFSKFSLFSFHACWNYWDRDLGLDEKQIIELVETLQKCYSENIGWESGGKNCKGNVLAQITDSDNLQLIACATIACNCLGSPRV